jgi:hypothetical protein
MMMEICFEPARGDPAVGVSNAVAGAIGAFSAGMVNLKAASRTMWMPKVYQEFQQVYVEMLEVQDQLLRKVTGLQKEVQDTVSDQLSLF